MFTCLFTQLIEVNAKVNSQSAFFQKTQLFLTNDSKKDATAGFNIILFNVELLY